ncbi:MAG: peptide chain release factor N(5)-glutamine methyltransferase [Peptococcaceae bacterium]|jgi:release factor glutamine methyltransferase|nr:peptide chain release factor N(5)-glutamine methyltransferase [Peptococcaceae bacterium]
MTERRQGQTGRGAYAQACRILKKAGWDGEAAGREARELLSFCWGKEGLALLLDFDQALPPPVLAQYAGVVEGRRAGKPMAYLTGRQYFAEREWRVTPGVLIPRQDTEILLAAVLERLPSHRPARALELGCGSGAVIGAAAAARPLLAGWAVDIDPLAVALTEENLRLAAVEKRVTPLIGAWFEPVPADLIFDLIFSNPPYISTAEMAELPVEVAWEPPTALWGGDDGLRCYREILPEACRRLAPGGWCLLEIGWRQGPAVSGLLAGAGFAAAEILRDLGGRDRVVVGKKPGPPA